MSHGTQVRLPQPTAPPQPTELRALRLFATEAAATLAALGVVVYGVIRLAADSAYAQLHTTPEKVGVTQAMILGRASLYLAFFVVFAVAAGTVWVLLVYSLFRLVARLVRSAVAAGTEDVRKSRLFALAIRSFALFGPLALLVLARYVVAPGLFGYFFESDWSPDELRLVAALAAWAAFVAAAWRLTSRWLMRVAEPDSPRWRQLAAADALALIGMLAVIGAAAFYLAVQYGRDVGSDVAHGNPKEATYQLLDVQALPVCLTIQGTPVPTQVPADRPYLYLGQANGYTVLLGPVSSAEPLGTVRLPTGQLSMVASTGGDESCK